MATTVERLQVEVTGDTSDAQEALAELEDAGSDIPNWVSGATASLAGLFAVGAGAGAALTLGLVGNISAEDAHAKLFAQLATTGPESERIGSVAGALYADAYGESMEEVDAAVGAVMTSIDGMATASSADLQDATAAVMDFASGFDVDVTRAAQVAGQMVKQGLAVDFDDAMNLMVASSQKVPAGVREDLLDATDEYGGFFTQLGFNGEEAFSALVNASDKGAIGIDKTGDALKEFTIRATDMSATSVAAYDTLGLSSDEMAAAILAGGDTAKGAFDEIVTGLLGMTDPTAQASAAIALFGTPLEDIGTSEIPAFLGSLTGLEDGLGDVSTAADTFSTTLNSGPSTALETFKRRISTAFTAITAWALPPLLTLADTLSATVAPAILAVGDFLEGTLLPALQSGAEFVARNATAFKVAAALILATFLPAMVAAATTAVVSGVSIVASWVASAAAATVAAASMWGAVVRVVAGWVASAAAAVASGATTVAIWAMYAASAVAGAAAQAVAMAAVVAGWVRAAAAAVLNGAIMVGQMALTAASVVGGWLLMAATSLIAAAQVALAWIIAMGPIALVIAAVIGLVALIVANWDAISAATSAAWTAIVGWVTAAWDSIVAWVTTAVAAVKAVIAAVFAAIVLVITTYINIWKAIILAVWNAITALVSAAVNAVSAVIGAVFSAIVWLITGYVNAWKAVIMAVWNAITALVSGAVAGVKAAITGLASIGSTIGGYFQQAVTAVTEKVTSIVTYVSTLPSLVVSALGSLGTTLYASGRSLLQGFLDGIKSMATSITTAASDMLGKVRDFFPFSPAKEGPFSGKGWVTHSGEALGSEFAASIADQASTAQRAASRLMAGAQGALGGGLTMGVVRDGAQYESGMGRLGMSSASGGAATVVIVDQHGDLIGRMQTEAAGVVTGRTTPLSLGMASW